MLIDTHLDSVRAAKVLCEDCNMGKSNKDQTDWRPKQPTIYQDGTAKVYRIK